MKKLFAILLLLMAVPVLGEDKNGGVVIYTPAGGGTSNPPAASGQILGSFGTVPEWETVSGDGTFTRTAAGQYNLRITGVNGESGPFISANNPTFTGIVTFPDGSTINANGFNGATIIGATLNDPTINNPAIIGVTNGSDAATGQVGEFRTMQGTATTPAYAGGDGMGYTVAATLTLPAGDWDVYANFYTLLTINGGTVVGAQAWWGVLLPSTIPLSATDGTPASANVAWIGGEYSSTPLAEGGTIGPVRFSQATTGSMDIRVIVSGTGGTALIDWVLSARRMR